MTAQPAEHASASVPDPASWKAVLADDLEKVRPFDSPRPLDASVPLTGFAGERIGFQVAIRTPVEGRGFPGPEPVVRVRAPGSEVALHRVDLVPVDLPIFPHHDDNVIDDRPGLYPDVLRPTGEQVRLRVIGWSSVWVDLTLTEESAGPVAVTVQVGDETVLEDRLDLVVTPAAAPGSGITNVQWLHVGSLVHVFDTTPYSEAHWKAIDAYVAAAAEMGVTALLTPVWTPPLDTAPGAYRENVQLLRVRHGADGYTVDTDLLDRFTAILKRHGIRQVEVAHLFTQWGAGFTPQIWVDDGDGPRRRFGWDVAATDPAYREFLEAAIPALRANLEGAMGAENVLWHISDEPHEEQLASYVAARGVVDDLLDGAVIIDALSSPQFASEVQNPIVATNHVKDFHAAGLSPAWVYYCVSQNYLTANRFIAQKAVGARFLGSQMFVQGATGFLQWGFNFYESQYSLEHVDPFANTTASGRFPGGDAFVVYPGPDGTCLPSLRHRVLATMAADQRVMAWAEQLAGRDAVLAVIDPDGALARADGYEAPWPDPTEYRRRRLALDELVRAHL